jgi:hypothetical protein
VFSIVELKTMPLDSGAPGISQAHALLLLLMLFAIPMIPYAFLWLSWRHKQGKASMLLKPSLATAAFGKMMAWVHTHRHPQLVHH